MTDKHDEKAREIAGDRPELAREIASALRQVERETLQWRPIETAPRDVGAHVLLYSADDGIHESWWLSNLHDDGWVVFGLFSNCWTHWMPLPPAPEKGKS